MSEEVAKQGTPCPVCGSSLRLGEKMVYCEKYKPRKDGNTWYNEGECGFHINFNQQKLFGKIISPQEVRRLLNGEVLKNPKGDTMRLNPDGGESGDFFLSVDFAPKKEDKIF